MGITRQTGEEEREYNGRTAPELGAVSCRRSLLGAVGGGLILATSGLLLPEWLVEESAAAGHPVRKAQGRKQKRRQKHHQALKHRRKDRRNRPRPAPGINLRSGINFYIHNDGSSSLATQAYSYYADGGLFSPRSWHQVNSETVQPGEVMQARTGHQESAAFIDNRFWLMANNPFVGWPEIYLRYDGKLEPETFVGYTGKGAISGMGFVVDLGTIERTIDGRRFSIKREKDEDYDAQNRIVFSVHIS